MPAKVSVNARPMVTAGLAKTGRRGEPVRGADVGADRGRGDTGARGRTGPGRRSAGSGRRWRRPRRATGARRCGVCVETRSRRAGRTSGSPGPRRRSPPAICAGDVAGDRPDGSCRCRYGGRGPVGEPMTTGLKCAPETGPKIRISTVEAEGRGDGVRQQLQPDVVAEAGGHDAGADHRGDQQRGAEELGEQPAGQRQRSSWSPPVARREDSCDQRRQGRVDPVVDPAWRAGRSPPARPRAAPSGDGRSSARTRRRPA